MHLPHLITIRVTLANGKAGRVAVARAVFAKAWREACAIAPKGAKVEALVAELYI